MEPEDIDYGDYDFEDDNNINGYLDINKNPSGCRVFMRNNILL